MSKQLKWMAPLLVIVTLLVSCGSPQYVQNDRDYGRGRNDSWTLLGERRADSRGNGEDIYPRGRYNNFSQLRFTTTGRDINLYGATIVYDNGRRESYKLNGNNRTVRLRNRNSNIRQIHLDYNTSRYDRRSNQGSILVYGR
ncbi:hypothetical protein U0035_14995 [Niabella yanshanensis]|uniref:Lipocalin-like domain-containing protein n=1 Tax=Niabella yanshanensis TaxID=577386 RepID=A0ABZ0W145_9BACT|nr:hypothetical protein [Niabella yanshanensis]WQD36978.1 hypothetical protein U0035_14995 [Niabella yanshanensis]